ncbi:MAG: asparagine synthase-related protein, partial [Nitrospinales bacterium]
RVLSYEKKGFGLPLKQWMANPLKELVRSRLQRLKQRPHIVAEEVDRCFNAFQAGWGSAESLWHLVALELWHERFFEGGPFWRKILSS